MGRREVTPAPSSERIEEGNGVTNPPPAGKGEPAARPKRARKGAQARRAEGDGTTDRPKRARHPAGSKRARRQAQAAADADARAEARPKLERRRRARAAGVPTAPRPARENLTARDNFYEQLRGDPPYLGVSTENGSFVFATTDQHIGRSLFVKAARPEFAVLRRVVAALETLAGEEAVADRLFVDIGANIGTSTVAALVSHRFGTAVCCEPDEDNYRLLRANVALNGLEERVASLRVAASDRAGRSDLVIHEGSSGHSWIAIDPGKIRDQEAEWARHAAEEPDFEPPEMRVAEVEMVTLDGLAETGVIDSDRVGLLWIDAEGHEGHVLGGAGSLADRGVPIVVEFHPEGLDERGDRDKVQELAAQCYSHFIDVRRRHSDRTQPQFSLRSVDDLRGYAGHLLDPSTPAYFTDLLLLRLDQKQASAAPNLSDLLQAATAPSE